MRDSDFKRKLFWACIDNLGKKGRIGAAIQAVEKPNAPQHGQPKICPRCKAVLSTESGFDVCDNCGYDGSDVGKLHVQTFIKDRI